MLVFVIFASLFSFSLSASASSSKVYNIKNDFELALFNEKGDALTGDRISLTTTQVNGVTYYRIYPKSLSDQSSFYSHSLRMVSALKLENLSLKTEYNIKVSFFTSQEYTFAVALNPGNGGESIILFTQDGKNNEIIDCNINFTLSELGLSSNNNLELVLFVIQNAEILGMSYYNFSDIVLTDLDDNSQFFDGIWGTIKHIFIAIVGGECSDGDFQSVGLFGKLAEGFSALGNKVSQLFTDFKNSWTAGINALKDKIESIQQWFVELGEKIADGFDYIVDMILYFEHPVEKNADGVPINTDTGQPVYTNPFKSVWEDIESKLNEWIAKISDFIDSMESARDNVISYMDTGKQLIDGVISGVPILGALFIFVAGFYVIRKVVGQ